MAQPGSSGHHSQADDDDDRDSFTTVATNAGGAIGRKLRPTLQAQLSGQQISEDEERPWHFADLGSLGAALEHVPEASSTSIGPWDSVSGTGGTGRRVGLVQQAELIRSVLEIDASLSVPAILREAAALVGTEPEGPLLVQAERLMESLGLDWTDPRLRLAYEAGEEPESNPAWQATLDAAESVRMERGLLSAPRDDGGGVGGGGSVGGSAGGGGGGSGGGGGPSEAGASTAAQSAARTAASAPGGWDVGTVLRMGDERGRIERYDEEGGWFVVVLESGARARVKPALKATVRSQPSAEAREHAG
jgi:hypothetical protein